LESLRAVRVVAGLAAASCGSEGGLEGASRFLVLAAAASLVLSAIIFSLASLNLGCSLQISALALFGAALSVPGPKPAQGSLAIAATMSAFSAATLASKGTRPLAMAPMRAKCWPITNSEPWR